MSLQPFHSVRLEPARSAEPPSSSGSSGPKPFSVFCEALRLAMVSALALDGKQTQEAKDWLKKEFPKAFESLANDRMGDALMLEHNAQEAKDKYLAAWKGMTERTQYRQIVEVKLAALGVDVHAQESQP